MPLAASISLKLHLMMTLESSFMIRHMFIVHATVLKIASVLSQNSPTIHMTEQHILDTDAGKQLS